MLIGTIRFILYSPCFVAFCTQRRALHSSSVLPTTFINASADIRNINGSPSWNMYHQYFRKFWYHILAAYKTKDTAVMYCLMKFHYFGNAPACGTSLRLYQLRHAHGQRRLQLIGCKYREGSATYMAYQTVLSNLPYLQELASSNSLHNSIPLLFYQLAISQF